MKRTALILSTLLIAAGSVFAGGGNESTDGKKTLRFSWWGGDSRHEATLAAIELFEEANPDIVVKAEYTGWQGHLEKITTALSGGTAPDLMQINWNWLVVFSKTGDGFYDMNEFSSVVDIPGYEKSVLDAVTINGKLNGIPISTGGRIFYWNQATFEKAGVAIPTTFDELIAAGKTFRENLGDNYYPTHLGWEETWLIMNLYISQKYGKVFIDPETSDVAVTAEEMTDAFNFYRTLTDNHAGMTQEQNASLGVDAIHMAPNWVRGEVAGRYEWNSAIPKSQTNLEEGQTLTAGPLLSLPDPKASGLFTKPLMLFCINKDTQYPQETAELLNFLLTDPEAIKTLSLQRGIPNNKSALKILEEAGALTGLSYEGHKITQDNLATALAPSPYFEHQQIKDNARNEIERFSYGITDASEAAEALVENARRILAQVTR